MAAAGEMLEYDVKSTLGAPLLIVPRGHLLKSFPQGVLPQDSGGLKKVFLLQGELPRVTEPHLSVCQLYRCQFGLTMWSSPTTMSLDPILVTALRVDVPGQSIDPATDGLACNCPVPESMTSEASGRHLQNKHRIVLLETSAHNVNFILPVYSGTVICLQSN